MENLSLEVEFPIDNARLKAESAEANRIITGVGETAESTGKRVTDRLTEAFEKPKLKVGDLDRSVASLKIQMQSYQSVVDKSFDSKVIADYNRKIDETANEIQRLKTLGRDAILPLEQGAVRAKSGFNGLQNSVNQISRELPAFTYSAQTGFMGISNNIPILVDELGRLKKANADLVASGGKGVPVWKSLIGSVFGWGTALSVGITLMTVYGKEIGNFISELFKGKSAVDGMKEAQQDLAKEMGKAGEASAKATIDIDLQKQAFDQARKGVITKTEALKLYNDKIGKTLGFTNDINIAEERTIKNGNAYIDLMFKKAKAAALLSLYQEQVAEQAKIDAKSNEDAGSFILSGTKDKSPALNKLYEKNAQRRRDEEKAPFVAKAEAFKKLILETDNDIKEFSKKNGLSFDELANPKKANAAPKDQYDAVLKSREQLARKINETVQSASLGDVTDEQKEINAIKKKFADFRFTIEEENKKITAYNKTSKRKISLLPIGDIDGAETNDLKAAADARRDKNFQEALKASETYETQKLAIEEKYAKLKADLLADMGKLKPGEYAERMAVLNENQKKENQTLEEGNVKVLASYKILYNELENLSKKELEEKLAIAKQKADADLASGDISKETYAELLILIKKTRVEIENISKIKLDALAGAFGQIGQALGGLNSGLGEAVSGIGSAIQNISKVKELGDKFQNASTDTEKFAVGANLAATAISGTVQLISMISNAAKERKKAEEEYYASVIKSQNDYNLSLNEQIRLKTILSENLFVKDFKGRIEDGTKALADANSLYEKSITKLQQEGKAKVGQRNAVDGKNLLNGVGIGAGVGAAVGSIVPIIGTAIGAVVGGAIGFIGGLFAKKKKDVFGGLFQQFPELIKKGKDGVNVFNEALAKNLIANNLVDEKTEALLNNTIALGEARKQAMEQINSVITDLAGDLGNNLRSSLVDAFKNGEDSAMAFGKTVSGVLENIISQMLFSQVFGESLDKLEQEMKASFDIGGDQNFIDDITRFYEGNGEKIKAYNAGLEEASKLGDTFGLDVFKKDGKGTDPNSNPNTIRGNVTNITANQADVLSGNIGGMRLAVIESNGIQREGFAKIALSGSEQLAMLKTQHLTQMEIASNTLRTANNTDRLKAIEEGITKMANSSNGIRAVGGP